MKTNRALYSTYNFYIYLALDRGKYAIMLAR